MEALADLAARLRAADDAARVRLLRRLRANLRRIVRRALRPGASGALARRIRRLALQSMRGDPRPPSVEQIERLVRRLSEHLVAQLEGSSVRSQVERDTLTVSNDAPGAATVTEDLPQD